MHSSYHSSRVEAAVTTRSVPSQTWPPPCSLFQSVMTGLLQDRVDPSKHSGKTDSSCLVEDLALGTLFFPLKQNKVVLVRALGHISIFATALLQASYWSMLADGFAELLHMPSTARTTHSRLHMPPTFILFLDEVLNILLQLFTPAGLHGDDVSLGALL